MKKLALFTIGFLAAGLYTTAYGQTTLYTTTGDFSGWTTEDGDTVSSSTAFDYDGSTVNGLGDSSPGGSSVGGSLAINLSSWTGGGYGDMADSPGYDYSAAYMSAIDPGSTPVTYPPPDYSQVAGQTVAYSGDMSLVYTEPTVPNGDYFGIGVLLNYNNNYGQFFGTSTYLGTIDGQSTYQETIPYTINATSMTYFGFSLLINDNFTPTSTFYVDDIQIQPVPEPGTMALFGLGAAGLLAIRRRKA